MSDALRVAYISSGAFAEQCAVSLASLFSNNTDFEEIEAVIIEDGISDQDKCRLLDLASKFGRKLDFITMPDPAQYYGSEKFSQKHVGHTYARMILGEILPQTWDRVLCLDSDMLILGSLKDLWNTDISDYYIGGVENGVGDKVMVSQLGVRPGTLYCNSGLGYVNLSAVRKDGIENKYREYMNSVFDSGRKLLAYEEEVINKCCYPKILRLPYKYNVMTINLVFTYDEFMSFRGAGAFYSEQEVNEAIRDPIIAHVANLFYIKKRMWEKDSDAPFTDEYMKYRGMTGWADLPAIDEKKTFRQLFMKHIWHMMPRRMALAAAAFIRNHVRPLLSKIRDDE